MNVAKLPVTSEIARVGPDALARLLDKSPGDPCRRTQHGRAPVGGAELVRSVHREFLNRAA
jgi:hypothetical protein